MSAEGAETPSPSSSTALDPATTPTGPTPAYRLDVDDAVRSVHSSAAGLASSDVDAHRATFGANTIVELKKESAWIKYLRQFADWMIGLLIACAVITGYLGDFATAGVLVVLVFINTFIGFAQEQKAEHTMEALGHLVEPTAEVYRDGTITEVPSSELVVGDAVLVSEGGSIPADLRLIHVSAFSTNDFALTGESEPTHKTTDALPHDVPTANRHNMAYAGTTVATGEATGLVVGVGMHTELGRIANLSESATRTLSPLQREMKRIATYITYAVAVLSVVLLVIAVAAHLQFREALLFAVGFASALVPQGLPAEVNTALAQAAAILARHHALVKQLSAVETLGSTHVICTDKTGTLTKNEMTVVELRWAGHDFAATGTGYAPVGAVLRDGAPVSAAELAGISTMLRYGAQACNARLLPADDKHPDWHVLGDPTEGSILTVAAKSGVDLGTLDDEPELREFPFDSVRKMMSSLRRQHSGTVLACVKGAPDAIVQRCTSVLADGGVRDITAADRDAFLGDHHEKSSRALRNIAIATRVLSSDEAQAIDSLPQRDAETGLMLLGMVSMMDPLRDAVPDAVAAALGAHIAINIVTGDSETTAKAIAAKAGLTGAHGITVVPGASLPSMSDAEVLRHALDGGTVFGRVAPEDKMRIVDLVKSSGAVVAVTGDGINDAPALRHADIGVAMGVTGTDVAKQSAAMVLLDDSFATLVGAIRQGRTIFRNIEKGTLSCLTSNLAEFFVNTASLAFAVLLGMPFALGVLQILAIDILGEIFPIAALGRDPEEGETMREHPRSPKHHIVNGHSLVDLVWCGFLMGALAIGAYLIATSLGADERLGSTVTYATILICQLVNIVQRRSVHGFFAKHQLHNRTFWGAVGVCLVIACLLIYVPPVADVFGMAALSIADWALVFAAALVFLAVREAALRAGLRMRAARAAEPAS